ncbi:hypothetical protein RND71_043436 [Anisodus tanguticus]|uniref:Ribosomal protein eL8/eL30/eS12/Gadd45 domain-containing protein n=1 Tax=Anisodus tanguticus TaxID=243964 RepID=A0AAE1UM89_9SOLA|nr:hypothetical protein RND71_043436 [Anisodus tanguticus]
MTNVTNNSSSSNSSTSNYPLSSDSNDEDSNIDLFQDIARSGFADMLWDQERNYLYKEAVEKVLDYDIEAFHDLIEESIRIADNPVEMISLNEYDGICLAKPVSIARIEQKSRISNKNEHIDFEESAGDTGVKITESIDVGVEQEICVKFADEKTQSEKDILVEHPLVKKLDYSKQKSKKNSFRYLFDDNDAFDDEFAKDYKYSVQSKDYDEFFKDFERQDNLIINYPNSYETNDQKKIEGHEGELEPNSTNFSTNNLEAAENITVKDDTKTDNNSFNDFVYTENTIANDKLRTDIDVSENLQNNSHTIAQNDETKINNNASAEQLFTDGTIKNKEMDIELNHMMMDVPMEVVEEMSYEDKLKLCSLIAQPMASRKLCKKIHKLIKKSWKNKSMFNGVKAVQKAIRKDNKGIVVFAGDVTPIDVISHLPIYCEDKSIPYVYVPLKQDISQAMGVYRPCLAVLIKRDDQYGELFDECVEAINNMEIIL